MPITRHLTFQPSYIRQDDQYLRSISFLGTALLIRTNQLFHPGTKRRSRKPAQDGEETQQLLGSQTWRGDEEKSA
jgi:hypothetical protein